MRFVRISAFLIASSAFGVSAQEAPAVDGGELMPAVPLPETTLSPDVPEPTSPTPAPEQPEETPASAREESDEFEPVALPPAQPARPAVSPTSDLLEPIGLLEGDDVEDDTAGKVSELMRLASDAFRKKRLPEAIRFINDLIAVKPYEAEYHFALALSYRFEKKYQEALKKYQDVLDLGGPKALVAILKAEVYAAEGDREKVYDQLKEAALGGRNIISDVHNLPVLETYRGDTEFIRLALQLERFEIQRNRRVDPFTNLFPKDKPESGSEPKPDQGEVSLSPEAQAELLRKANRLADRIQFYVKLQSEEKAMKAYMELKDLVAKQNLITVPKIEKSFRRIISKLPDIEIQIEGIRLRYYYTQAQQKLKNSREVFDDGQYSRVEKIHLELENLAREMTTANAKYGAVASQILDRSKKWVNRARVRLEFDTKKPDIQGIIISGGDKMTILNERVVKQGESLNGFRVVKIESNRVTFRYKGEEIPMVFRRY